MLVPRYLRKGVRERVISNGTVKTPLHEDDVRAACRFFIEEGVEAVAISFVWSVLNQSHERRAAEIVREMMPEAALTVGSELYPQVREYTRTSTAVVNAYLAPILTRYVAAVDDYFRRLGAKYPVRYFQSNGGLALGQAISERSVYAINSGPASAPQAGLFVTAPFKKKNVITIDMGGTSFDITLTRNGVTNVNKNIDLLRYRIGIPMIQVETLGAGGGSIGWIDAWGCCKSARRAPARTRVRPATAKAAPADRHRRQSRAGLPQSEGPARRSAAARSARRRAKAIKSVADPLGISVERAAYGMYTIVNSNMVNGIRRVSVERGYDPRDFVLVGAGGATAAHITSLAGEMGIDTVILPKLASGLCAFGQIISDVKYNYMATSPLRLEGNAYATINRLFEEIEAQGVKHLVADGFNKSAIRIERSLDMRYVGQVHECTVEIGNFAIDAKALEKVKDAFHKRHEELYTYSEPHNAVEVVNIESTLYGHVEKPQPPRVRKGVPPAKALVGRRKAIFAADGKLANTPVYDGSKLGAGATIKGPAIIEEVTTTIVIEPKWTAKLDASGSYVITRK